MIENYFEYECVCSKKCGGELYFQPDTIKEDRVIMLGTTDGGEEANVWITPDDAIRIANDLIKLAEQLKEEVL